MKVSFEYFQYLIKVQFLTCFARRYPLPNILEKKKICCRSFCETKYSGVSVVFCRFRDVFMKYYSDLFCSGQVFVSVMLVLHNATSETTYLTYPSTWVTVNSYSKPSENTNWKFSLSRIQTLEQNFCTLDIFLPFQWKAHWKLSFSCISTDTRWIDCFSPFLNDFRHCWSCDYTSWRHVSPSHLTTRV